MANSQETGSKPLRQAVALRYRQGKDSSPRVVATGKGHMADLILQKAKEAGIALVEDPDLVSLLGKIPLGETVPEDLYRAVAEILSYVYRINKNFSKS